MLASTPSKTDTTDIRIVLIDDHELFLHGLRMLIEKEPGLAIAGQAMTRAEALEVVRVKPDIILLDLALGNENSIEFIPALIEAAGDAPCLIVTGMAEPDLHLQAVRLGIKGILLKSEAPSCLFKAIRKIHDGEVWFSRSLVSSAMSVAFGPGASGKTDRETAKIAELTAREREVITLIAEGRKNKQIAERLFISEKTVGHYLTSIFSKLEVSDRLELLIYACQHGLAKIPALPVAGSDYSRAS